MIIPSLDKAKQLGAGNTMIPLALEIFSGVKTPIEVLKNIRSENECWYLLESVNSGDHWGRYTFLGYDPSFIVYGTNETITIKDKMNETTHTENPLQFLRCLLAENKSPSIPDLPPFTGGFVGYFAYDFVQHIMPGLQLQAIDCDDSKDFHLMRIDKLLAFDHFKQKIYLIINIPTDNLETNYISGISKLKDMQRNILRTSDSVHEISACGEFTSTYTEHEFSQMVDRVKNHITEGDIFQAVISNRFKAPFMGSLLEAYRNLRTTSPSPYMVYMKLGEVEVICTSPETLVSLRDGTIHSFPLAGTCPRGNTPEEDLALIDSLLSDAKELAEHNMLVDLARNDIGKISKFGSVEVKEYQHIKRFSHVSHISSHVAGKLAEGIDPLDIIAAAMPAGTLSGAPKKRACEIIDAVEGTRRGLYGGAIGYIDFTGNIDMCIGIRMAVLKGGNVLVQSGAGIVADSIPEKEYQEIQNKARAVIDALKCNEGA